MANPKVVARRGHKHIAANLLSDTLTAGDVLYVNSSGSLVLLPIGNEDGVLTVTSGVPAWSGGLTSPVAIPEFPITTFWNAILVDLGGTAIPASNARYWDRPVYPTVFTATHASVSALNTALASSVAGEVHALADGSHTGKITMPNDGTAANPITVCAETLGGVDMNESEIQMDGDYNTACGFVDAWFDMNDQDALVHDCVSSNFATATTHYTIYGNSPRQRVCYCTFTNGTYQVVHAGTYSNTRKYDRFDHNRVIDHEGGVSGASEVIQVGQDQEGDMSHFLFDNNWISGADGSAYSEGEYISFKSSGNGCINNLLIDNGGTMADRTGSSNWWFGNYIQETVAFDSGNPSGGPRLGPDSVAACNIMVDLDQDNLAGGSALGSYAETTIGTYSAADRAEYSYNSILTCFRCIEFGRFGGEDDYPDIPRLYNNAASQHASATVDTVWHNESTGTMVGAANIFAATDGIAESFVTEGDPGWTSTFNIPIAAAGGNLDGASGAGANALITVDFFGSAIPVGGDIGAIQAESHQYVHTDTIATLQARVGSGA